MTLAAKSAPPVPCSVMSAPKRSSLLLGLAAFVAFAACADRADEDPGKGVVHHVYTDKPLDGNDAPMGPTWNEDIAAIVAANCAACHGPSNHAPFRLDLPQTWKSVGELAEKAIDSGRMPPFYADPKCGKFASARVLQPADKAKIKEWLANGRPLGPPVTNQKYKPPEPIKATHSAKMATAYTPKDVKDDYRCFLLDLAPVEDVYMHASEVVPGNEDLVHHVLVYALSGKQLKIAQEADAKQAAPGYACFGGPLPSKAGGDVLNDFIGGFPTQLAAWVPGIEATDRGPDEAIRIPKGSRIVMQVHYNMAGAKPSPDLTRLDMVLSTTEPKRLISTRPLLIHDFVIQPDQTSAHQRLFRYYGKEPLQIRSLTPHMHLLGKSFSATVVRADNSEECALSVPAWDFQWQQSYARPLDEPLVLKNGDGLRIRCVFDNSLDKQPFENEVQLAPQKVEWGDGSRDEMCMLYLDMAHPFSPSQAAGSKACAGYETCKKACAAKKTGAFDCIMSCDAVNAGCHNCAISQVLSCAKLKCPFALLKAQQCLTRCLIGGTILGSNPGACLQAECGTDYTSVRECLDPLLTKGTCKKKLATCGI